MRVVLDVFELVSHGEVDACDATFGGVVTERSDRAAGTNPTRFFKQAWRCQCLDQRGAFDHIGGTLADEQHSPRRVKWRIDLKAILRRRAAGSGVPGRPSW